MFYKESVIINHYSLKIKKVIPQDSIKYKKYTEPVYDTHELHTLLDQIIRVSFGEIEYTATWQTIDVPPPLPFISHKSALVISRTSDEKGRREAAN